jgi:hypothetical protein
MPDKLIFEYNKPAYVCLVDPAGHIDQWNQGHYTTTAGQEIVLPRQAVVALNMAAPRPGEEIKIFKGWNGLRGGPVKWQVTLTGRGELPPLEAPETASTPESSAAPATTPEPERKPIQAPTPIRKATPPAQPRLFDARGTGTYGPAPARFEQPEAYIIRPRPQIPANVATKEILEFINADQNTANWSATAKEALAETVLQWAYQAGHIGLWERGE